MHRYIAQRLLQGLLSAFLVSLLIFVILRIAPGDVAMMVYTQGDEGIADIDEEALDRIRENLGAAQTPAYAVPGLGMGHGDVRLGHVLLPRRERLGGRKAKAPCDGGAGYPEHDLVRCNRVPLRDTHGVEAGHLERLRRQGVLPWRALYTQFLDRHHGVGGWTVRIQLEPASGVQELLR